MTNKLVAIINSLKVPKVYKILLYEMKFLVPNYSCLQKPWLGGYRPQIPVLSVLCTQLNLLNPPPRTKFLGTPLLQAKWPRNRGSSAGRDMRLFFFTKESAPSLGTVGSCWKFLPWALSRGVKQPQYKADHKTPPNTKISNEWSSNSTAPHVLLMRVKSTLLYNYIYHWQRFTSI